MDIGSLSILFFICGIVGLCGGSRFDRLNITTSPSPFSDGESALYLESGELCSCGPHSECGQRPNQCSCDSGYVGTPPRCQVTPELWALCYKDNPCGPNSECWLKNGTRQCACAWPYEGAAPHCRSSPAAVAMYCDQKGRCGANAWCHTNRQQCFCLPGFVGSPPSCQPGVALLGRCNPYPCGGHSDCHMQDGVPVCSCRPGFIGAPPNCAPGPEVWRLCFKDNPCGLHSECRMENRTAVCLPCPQGFHGDPPFCLYD